MTLDAGGCDPHDERSLLETRRAQAYIQISHALDLVEQAQGLLGQAQQALCRVEGMIPEWNTLGNLYDRLRSPSTRVRIKTDRLRTLGGPLVDRVNVR